MPIREDEDPVNAVPQFRDACRSGRRPCENLDALRPSHQRARIRSTAACFFGFFVRMRWSSVSHAVSARRISSR